MIVRGQNLVWSTGEQTPAYAFGDGTNSAANQALVTSNIQEHIQSEVQHFGTKVYAWDVVNEPLDPTQSDCLEHGPFYQVLGQSYIDIAFKAARQYAPAGTKLFINEYSTADPDRLACLVSVVQDLRARGIPSTQSDMRCTTPSTIHPRVAWCMQSTPCRSFPRHRSANYRVGYERVQRRRYNLELWQQYSASVLAEQGWLYKQYFDAFR